METRYDDAGFRTFIKSWNRLLGQDTPAIHLEMANWLELAWRMKDQQLLLMAFRSSGKSTIVGLFAAWLLYRNPDLRIMVLAADSLLAKKMVRNVKRILERHDFTGDMRPAKAEEWASDKFTVKRLMVSRDPSMLARGVTSNITGSRADVVICDDVEVPVTCDSAEKRESLRERLSEISYVLVPGGTQLYIGTPHSYYTIYAKDARVEIGEEHPFLEGFVRKLIPVLNEQGESTWPERFDLDHLRRIKRQTGPNKFASQMMLQPVNITEGRLNPDLLQVYEGDLYFAKEIGRLHINGKVMISASCWWDPAFGSAKGDNSVLACIFVDTDGNFYLQHLEYISLDPHSDVDELVQQCRIVAQIAKRFMLPSVSVETNGIGKFLPSALRNEMVRANVQCAVIDENNKLNKADRILEAFDAILAARRLFVNSSVFKTPFMREMREWRPDNKRMKDDGLDAVAGALLRQPVRIERLYGHGAQIWQGNGKVFMAKTDFKV